MRNNTRWIIITQLMLLIYSGGGICTKLAARESFLSFRFLLYYGMLIFAMAIYAIGWQQIIKHLPLTTAYANKAMTVVWGIIWGTLIFQERLTLGKVIGAAFVIMGVVLFAGADHELES